MDFPGSAPVAFFSSMAIAICGRNQIVSPAASILGCVVKSLINHTRAQNESAGVSLFSIWD